MSFQLSPELDSNKVFLINRSELKERLDPSSYSIKNLFLNTVFSLGNLKDYFLINPSQKEKIMDKYIYPFLPMENISEKSASVVKIGGIKGYESKSYTSFNEGDFIFAKITPCMENGKMAIVRNLPNRVCFGSTEFHVFREKNKKISVDFLRSIFLISGFKEYAKNNFTGTSGHQRIPPEFFYKLKIPIPPKKIQAKIVTKMDNAYTTKKQKEKEAQLLLDSIDGYLLGELGVELSKREENTIQSRIFTRRLSEVSGGRFDPKLYDNKTVSLKMSIEGSNFPKCRLKQLVTESVAGDWGKELDSDIDGFSKCLVIRATEFDNLFNLNLNNKRLKYRLINNKKLQKISVNENDLLIEKSGGSPDQPVGRVAIITTEILSRASIIGYSNFIQKLRVDKDLISPSYLFCFLKTMHSIGLTDAMQSQTNGIRNLIMGNFYDQNIPLPPIKKQTEISTHITNIHNLSKQLQQQAKEELEKAKKEVEAIILGEDAKKV